MMLAHARKGLAVSSWLRLVVAICWAAGFAHGTKPPSVEPPSMPVATQPQKGTTMLISGSEAGLRIAMNGEVLAEVGVPGLGAAGAPMAGVTAVEEGWQQVRMAWDVPAETRQDEVALRFDLAFAPEFWWAPHLAPMDGFVVGQHVFRSPAIVVAKGQTTLVIVPDLDIVGKNAANPWFLDYDARSNQVWLGMSLTDIPISVLYKKKPGMAIAPGKLALGFYVLAYRDLGPVPNPWARVTSFVWERWARPLYAKGEPIHAPMERYVGHTYRWAFDSWKAPLWQEFEVDGKRVGAPQFIVNVSQSPNYPGEWYQREFLSIWNQAWFSSMRSASGLYRHAKASGDAVLAERALLAKELALAAPMDDGLFPSVIRTDNEKVSIDGKNYARPKGWEHAYWTNSNRCPWDHGIGQDWYHVLDMSWTALLMLRWHDELEADPRLSAYAAAYADRLLRLQDDAGFFPGWLHPETHVPGGIMNQTPETSMSVTFLLEMAKAAGEPRYREAALRAMDAVIAKNIPVGQWEDFETYWSSGGWGHKTQVHKKVARNGLYKHNNFCIFWTAEALLACYKATQDKRYLDWGRRTLDELSMWQQVWQPPFIHVPSLGGFGVMSADGEWNDSRQNLFAECYLDYYKETGDIHLFERGVAALQSGFIMMYCPENPGVKAQWEKAHPFFGPEDYGFTMENYAHGGAADPEGGGMGVFTIYDWGNGAAAEAFNRIRAHWGDVYVDTARKRAFGINSLSAEYEDGSVLLQDQTGQDREVLVVYDTGERKTISLAAGARSEFAVEG